MSVTMGNARAGGSRFGLIFVGGCTLLVFFGFSFTLLSRVIEQLRPLVLYLHAASASAWLLLLVAQAWLAKSRKLALHRRFGKYGFILGMFVAVSAFAAALVLRHDAVIAHGLGERPARLAFLSIPLNGAIDFSILLVCAWLWRFRPDIHRRCMLLAAAVLTLPAVARIPIIGKSQIWGYAPTLVLLLILCIADLARNKRLHPVYAYGVPAILTFQFTTQWLYDTAPTWWVQLAARLCGVTVR